MEQSSRLSRRDWAIILALAAINFLHIVDFVIIMPLGDQLMAELHLDPGQFGWIVSAYAGSAMLATLLGSAVIDRFDRRTVLLAMFAGFAVSTLACGLSDTYATLLISRAFAGIFGGLAAAMILAIIGDRFADARRGTATGAVMSGFAVASVVGLPLGLMLANHFGRGAPFIAIAVLCVPVGIAAAFLIPSFTGHRAHARSIRRDLHQVLTTRRHVIAFVFMFTLVMGTFTIIPFLAPYIVRNAGRSADDVPIIYLIAGICTFISLNALGRLADAYGKKPVFIAMAVMALLMTLTITNLPQVGLFAAIAAATGFMIAASGRMVPAQAMMLASATPALRGAFVNINSAVQHLAMSVAPVVAGSVMGGGETGPLTGYPIVGAIAASFSILSLILCNLLEPAPHDLPAPVTIPKPTVEPSGEALPATTNA